MWNGNFVEKAVRYSQFRHNFYQFTNETTSSRSDCVLVKTVAWYSNGGTQCPCESLILKMSHGTPYWKQQLWLKKNVKVGEAKQPKLYSQTASWNEKQKKEINRVATSQSTWVVPTQQPTGFGQRCTY